MVNFVKESLTQKEYHLKCKIAAKSRPHRSGSGQRYDAQVVILIPEHNAQGIRFFRAWEVEDSGDDYKFEFAVFYPEPLGITGRASVAWPNDLCDKIHIMVMNKTVEDILLRKVGQTIDITVYGEDDDEKADEVGSIEDFG
jgi:hypothetical protein